ncbi:MAG: efflux RND transporter periplasmic adaptor subunit [Armatimonadota bacterium]|nr:efflux RND transporter periplasmic adaptor subunit [Armatimonadota bacterium]
MKIWTWIRGNSLGLLLLGAAVLGTGWIVRRLHRPGQLDVISAQAMDMSAMRPPTGAAPVALASVRQGALADTVTYTGSVQAFNEQEIAPRIAGTLVALSVYPGDPVRAGQVVARLDTAELGAKAAEAAAQSQEAQQAARVAGLNHQLHHQAALAQANAQLQAAQQAIPDAQAQAQAAQDAVTDAQAGVTSAQANTDYWQTEIVREKQLADAGAVSRQEYQSELSQAKAAQAAQAQARSKVRQAQAMAASGQAKIAQARHEAAAAQAGRRMAQADIVVAEGQARQAAAGARAAEAASHEAAVVKGYARIVAPFNGVVTARPVAPGTLVQPGTVILKIAEIDRVRLQANVAVADLAGIRVGTLIQATLLGGDAHSLTAHVTAVFPSASAQTRTAVVEAIVPNPGGRLRPGQFVTMRIAKNGVSDSLLVPASAIVTQNGEAAIWLARGAGAASAPTQYRCEKCHMTYSAADARKNHLVDPMDGGRLLPVHPKASAAGARPTAHRVPVQIGASDGNWTEVAGDLASGARVVTHGQAGLTEGASIVATAWGPDGPQTLPKAMHGTKLFRCEKCGMTYSEADAKRNNFVDPMDGGTLTPVEDK